jgi:hypothetical protein
MSLDSALTTLGQPQSRSLVSPDESASLLDELVPDYEVTVSEGVKAISSIPYPTSPKLTREDIAPPKGFNYPAFEKWMTQNARFPETEGDLELILDEYFSQFQDERDTTRIRTPTPTLTHDIMK